MGSGPWGGQEGIGFCTLGKGDTAFMLPVVLGDTVPDPIAPTEAVHLHTTSWLTYNHHLLSFLPVGFIKDMRTGVVGVY